jgi:hypothetical protein
MPLKTFRLLRAAAILCVAALCAGAVTLDNNQRLTNAVNASSPCSTPAAVTAFSPGDARAYVWFTVSNARQGDVPRFDWIGPDNQVYSSVNLDPLAADGGWCIYPSLAIAGTAAAGKTGAWSVRAYWNGAGLFSLPFTIGGSGGSGGGSAPHIDYLNPDTVTAGVEQATDVSGSGFPNPAIGIVRETAGSGVYTLSGTQVRYSSVSLLNVLVTMGKPGSAGSFTLEICSPGGANCSNRVPFRSVPGGSPGGSGGSSIYAVGDRVASLIDRPDNNPVIVTGDTGKVACVLPAGQPYDVLIEWDRNVQGHSGNGSCAGQARDGHGWFVKNAWIRAASSGGGGSGGGTPPQPSGTNILFDSSAVSSGGYLFPEQLDPSRVRSSSTDSQGNAHTYHVFAITDSSGFFSRQTMDRNGLRVRLQAEGAGSTLSIDTPSAVSSAALQLYLPFGLTISTVTAINADLGAGAPNQAADGIACGFKALALDVLSTAAGPAYTAGEVLACAGLFRVAVAGEPCSPSQPIVNSRSLSCLADPGNHTLFGEKALNTHQIRNVIARTRSSGVTTVRVQFHLDAAPARVLDVIRQRGITLYVTTPAGDYWLDNFR